MKKLLKKRKLIKHHKEQIKMYEKMLEEIQEPSFQGYVVKSIERIKKTIKKLKRL